jgi:hypothetical protein
LATKRKRNESNGKTSDGKKLKKPKEEEKDYEEEYKRFAFDIIAKFVLHMAQKWYFNL